MMSRELMIAQLLALRSQAQAMATQCTAILAVLTDEERPTPQASAEFADTFDSPPPAGA